MPLQQPQPHISFNNNDNNFVVDCLIPPTKTEGAYTREVARSYT